MKQCIYDFIAMKIKELRSARHWSQTELAAKISAKPNTISRWESAEYHPTIENLDSLARIFEVQIWALLPNEIQPPTRHRDALRALLSATGDLPEEDIHELQRYAEFIRARKSMRLEGSKRSSKG